MGAVSCFASNVIPALRRKEGNLGIVGAEVPQILRRPTHRDDLPLQIGKSLQSTGNDTKDICPALEV